MQNSKAQEPKKGKRSFKSLPTGEKVICTNIDGTLVGHDKSMYELLALVENRSLLLIFNTGRDLSLLKELIDNKQIGKPDASICMVGTEVYFVENGEFILDKQWSRIISEGWNRRKIVESLSDIKELIRQDSLWQTEFKISYLLRENQEEVLREINSRLQEAKLEAKVIYSSNEFLDFLPQKASKSGALKYIITKLGIDREDVVVCGDSGNDLELFENGYKGIIVGNAHPELKSYTGENAYHASREYSAGIIEGLRQFHWI